MLIPAENRCRIEYHPKMLSEYYQYFYLCDTHITMVIAMYDFMLSIYSHLPKKYAILSEKLKPEHFAELMRRLMSLKFRMRPLPRRMWIKANGRSICVGSKIIRVADSLLEELIKSFRNYGVNPKLVIKHLSS